MCWLADKDKKNISWQETWRLVQSWIWKEAFKKHLLDKWALTHARTHMRAQRAKRWAVSCPCSSLPLSVGHCFLFSLSLSYTATMTSILHTCQGSGPADSPQGRYPHSLSQVLSFHTSICLSIHPTIHLLVHLLLAICLSDEAMILRLISALWIWSSLGTNFTPTHPRTHTLKPLLSATLVRAVRQLQETETWRG